MDINLVGTGPNNNIEAQVDPSTQALRASLKPVDWVASGGVPGGHYAIGAVSGTIAAGIASLAEVFHVRWADPSKLFILQRLVVQCATGTGFAATTLGAPLDLIVGHGSTANGSGGTAIAPSSISNRMRSNMAASAFVTSGRLAIASTGALTAATGQTLEPASISACMGAPNATLAQSVPMILFEVGDAGDHPLILNSGDTLAVRAVTPAATGTWFMSLILEWIETVAF